MLVELSKVPIPPLIAPFQDFLEEFLDVTEEIAVTGHVLALTDGIKHLQLSSLYVKLKELVVLLLLFGIEYVALLVLSKVNTYFLLVELMRVELQYFFKHYSWVGFLVYFSLVNVGN